MVSVELPAKDFGRLSSGLEQFRVPEHAGNKVMANIAKAIYMMLLFLIF